VAIEMSSDDFDTYVELFSDGPNGRESIGTDDDSGDEGTDSRLVVSLPADGDYLIEARAFAEAEGDYELKLTETAPDPVPTPLAFGATVQGEITDEDPRGDEGGRFEAYTIQGQAGGRMQAIMRSGDFDTVLHLGRPGEEFSALVSDDDGLGEGTDSRLNYVFTESGEYILRAAPLTAEGRGLYSLELIDRGPKPLPGTLLLGETVRGTLSEADSLTDDGAYQDTYRISTKEGEKLRFTLLSNAFDAYVEVGTENEDGVFEQIQGDDDSLSDTHARLDWTATEDGVFVVRARSFAPNQTGPYALTIARKP
jgi:hypothetical protein